MSHECGTLHNVSRSSSSSTKMAACSVSSNKVSRVMWFLVETHTHTHAHIRKNLYHLMPGGFVVFCMGANGTRAWRVGGCMHFISTPHRDTMFCTGLTHQPARPGEAEQWVEMGGRRCGCHLRCPTRDLPSSFCALLPCTPCLVWGETGRRMGRVDEKSDTCVQSAISLSWCTSEVCYAFCFFFFCTSGAFQTPFCLCCVCEFFLSFFLSSSQ